MAQLTKPLGNTTDVANPEVAAGASEEKQPLAPTPVAAVPQRPQAVRPGGATSQGRAPVVADIPPIPPDKKTRVIRVHPIDASTEQPDKSKVLMINAFDFDQEQHACCTTEDQRVADVELKARRITEDQNQMSQTIKRLTRHM